MRFGREYYRHQVPEWSAFYMNYNACKQLWKAALIQAYRNGTEPNISGLMQALQDDFDKVSKFHIKKQQLLEKRRTFFESRYGALQTFEPATDLEQSKQAENVDKYGFLTELSRDLHKLQWYDKVNHDGFKNILYKLKENKVNCNFHSLHKLQSLSAHNQHQCLSNLEQVDRVLETISQSLQGHRHEKDIVSLRLSEQGSAIGPRDCLGRLPLHNAVADSVIHNRQIAFDRINNIATAAEAVLAQDHEGHTPLHLAVIGGSYEVAKLLLDTYQDTVLKSSENRVTIFYSFLGSLLALSLRYEFVPIAFLLLLHGADIGYQGAVGETNLLVAVQYGQEKIVKTMLESGNVSKNIMDLPDRVQKRTPLHVACIEGHISIVRLLVRAGADQTISDRFGWKAIEHAAFRGHLGITKYLASSHTDQFSTSPRKVSPHPILALLGLPPKINNEDIASSGWHGRRFMTYILVTLGASNKRKDLKAVDLNNDHGGYSRHLNTGLGLVLRIRAINATGPDATISLPLLRDITNQPHIFTSEDPDKAALAFDISYEGRSEEPFGGGIALLSSLKRPDIAPKHDTLAKDYTIPILAKDTLVLLGSVTFNFVLVKPFRLPHIPATPEQKQGFWEKNGPTQVVGHRGSGANNTARTSLQIGENTVQSFLTATALGARCVEFGKDFLLLLNVQLTKDLKPVIFHDFIVMETGADIPLHTLTSDQFVSLSKTQSPRGDLSGMAETRYLERNSDGSTSKKPRSWSVNLFDDYRSNDLNERIKLTEEGMNNEIKGNIRGHSIQEVFPSLEELLTKLPESIAFDIELKYPMLWEAEDKHMEATAFEINIFVDTILEMVFRLEGNRNITFSSFSPETCILLSMKQQRHPILFINKAGSVPVGDVRAGSLQQAIQFAKRWKLAGIVMLSDPFVYCPRLIGYAKSSGLVCGTYGNQNDEPRNVLVQAEAGLDAVVTNKIRLISKTLAEEKD